MDTIPLLRRGRPLSLGELDKEVQSYVKALRAAGTPVTVPVINPRRACAARVTVVGLCVCVCVCVSVCLSVCLSVPLICDPRLQGGQTAIPTASVLRGHCFKCCVFSKTVPLQR